MALITKVIRTDGGTQMRAEVNKEFIAELAEIYRADANGLPPLEVFLDGEDYWLADGFHRHAAAMDAQLDRIECNVQMGTKREAILFAVGANARHGMRRTNEDKRKAVLTLLEDQEWGKMSDRWVADKVGVSNNFVSHLRKVQVSSDDTWEDGQIPTIVGRDGKSYRRSGRGQRNDDPEDRVLNGEAVQLDEEPEEDDLFGNSAYLSKCESDARNAKYKLKNEAGKLLSGIMAIEGDDTREYNACCQAVSVLIECLAKWERM